MTWRALERTGESRFVTGNRVTLLQDGPAVFGAWLETIRQAQHSILLENYIIHEDQVGSTLIHALIKKAREGVQVYVLYDWLGSLGTSPTLWRALEEAGGYVQAFNPIRLSNPLQGIWRDHSKLLCVDQRIAFVGGLCVGDNWIGNDALGIAPWRDTAVCVEGPAVLPLCNIFHEMWTLRTSGGGPGLLKEKPPNPSHGSATVQVVHGVPSRTRLYRSLQSLFATAVSKIWIADAYFILPFSIQEALIAAARDGVDVRVLVPRHSDLPWVAWVSRAGYASLLSAGVRIFEWEGVMLHAKTAVIDNRWSKIGSSNLTVGSFYSNYEIDLLVDQEELAQQMENQFLHDLQSSSELLLSSKKWVKQKIRRLPRTPSVQGGEGTETARVKTAVQDRSEQARTVLARAGATVLGMALRRPFQQSTLSVASLLSGVLLLVGIFGLWFPTVLGVVIALLTLWLGIGLSLRALSQRRKTAQPRMKKRCAS